MIRIAIPCECADHHCPTHQGEDCSNESTIALYRMDMEDETGTRFYGDCADDAIDSGLFYDQYDWGGKSDD